MANKKGKSKINKRGKGKSSNNNITMRNLPKGMSIVTKSGMDGDALGKAFSRSHNDMLYLKDGDTATVAFLTPPEGFSVFKEHASIKNTMGMYISAPCTEDDDCLIHKNFPNNEPNTVAFVPVYHYEEEAVKFFRASSKVVTELIARYDRSPARFLGRQYSIIRDGERLDTAYIFEVEDDKVSKSIKRSEQLDSSEVLTRQLQYRLNQLNLLDEDDDEEDEDEYEDIDDEEEEDDEDDEMDDADDDGEDYDDDDDDDEMEDLDDDDDDDEPPTRRKVSTKNKKNSKKNSTKNSLKNKKKNRR